MKLTWIDIAERLNYELRQCEEVGVNVTVIREEWRQAQAAGLSESELQIKAGRLYEQLEQTSAVIHESPDEPSSWEGISALCQGRYDEFPILSTSSLENRILGGWLGRSAGCLLGKPIEGKSRSVIIELLSSNGTWPLGDYITAQGIPEVLLQRHPWNKHSGKESLRENIVCMTEDDDMNYPMLNLSAYEQYGEGVTTEHIGQTWLSKLPVLSTFTAERVAYINLLAGVLPPHTARRRNPYREWIGAQIRADLWGWISPGQPARAAEFAWRDARLSHVQNGMYAEMFFAAAIAAAFTSDNVADILREAARHIPPRSRLAAALMFVMSLPLHQMRWNDIVDLLYEKFGTYHWVHSINNAALVVAALLSSGGDYEGAICNAVMGGWDTDCNGATVGSIMGTMLGADNLPRKWISPLDDRIRSSLQGFDNIRLSELARRTMRAVQDRPTI